MDSRDVSTVSGSCQVIGWKRHLVLCQELNRSQAVLQRRFKNNPAVTALAMSRSVKTSDRQLWLPHLASWVYVIAYCTTEFICITLSCVGAMLLCWRAMPGDEFSHGPVSKRWWYLSSIAPPASISILLLSSQRETDSRKFISVSGPTPSVKESCCALAFLCVHSGISVTVLIYWSFWHYFTLLYYLSLFFSVEIPTLDKFE